MSEPLVLIAPLRSEAPRLVRETATHPYRAPKARICFQPVDQLLSRFDRIEELLA